LIQIFVTGGTMDKIYDVISGEPSFGRTHVEDCLTIARCRLDIQVETLMLVDSTLLEDKDRNLISDKVTHCPASQIIITHGTDTMTQSAEYIKAHLTEESLCKTIIFTGAMLPYFAEKNDVLFNIGTAIAFVQCLHSGVYVAINGQAFPAGSVYKNKQLGIFEPLYSSPI